MSLKSSFNRIMIPCVMGILLTRKLFPKLYCVLNMVAMNLLSPDSPSLIQVDEINLNWVFILTSSRLGHLQGPPPPQASVDFLLILGRSLRLIPLYFTIFLDAN